MGNSRESMPNTFDNTGKDETTGLMRHGPDAGKDMPLPEGIVVPKAADGFQKPLRDIAQELAHLDPDVTRVNKTLETIAKEGSADHVVDGKRVASVHHRGQEGFDIKTGEDLG